MPRVLFVATSFAGLLATAATVGYGLVTPEQPAPVDQYRGTVQFAPDRDGKCERFEFDNRTGALRREGAALCSAENSAPLHTDGPIGTMGSVRDYFRSR